MGARQDLADKLAQALPKKFKVIPSPRTVDQIEAGHPVVMIIRDSIQRNANALGNYKEKYALWVLATKTQQPAVEDELDDLADEVIAALDGVTWLTWDLATRSLFGTAEAGVPAYKLDITLYSSKEQS